MIDTAAGLLNPVRVSADILSKRWPRGLANRSPGELDGVVITVPAYFDDAQRQGTKRRRAAGGPACTAPAQRTGGGGVAYGLDSRQRRRYCCLRGISAAVRFDILFTRLSRGVF